MEKEYEQFLRSGMFWVVFPHLSGVWEKDMADFIEFVINRGSDLQPKS